MKTLLRESTLRLTKLKELISGWTDYIGVKYASSHNIGGVVFGKKLSCTPTVFRMQCPEWVKIQIFSSSNRTGTLINSYLEISRLLLLWIVIEEVCEVKSGDHVVVFSNKQPRVSWVDRLASKSSVFAGQLLRALALRLKIKGTLPLTPFHISGKQSVVMYIPSHSFGSEPKLNCKTNTELLFCLIKILLSQTRPLGPCSPPQKRLV